MVEFSFYFLYNVIQFDMDMNTCIQNKTEWEVIK